MSARDKKRRKSLKPDVPDNDNDSASLSFERSKSGGRSSASHGDDGGGGDVASPKSLSQSSGGGDRDSGSDGGGRSSNSNSGDNGSEQSRSQNEDTQNNNDSNQDSSDSDRNNDRDDNSDRDDDRDDRDDDNEDEDRDEDDGDKSDKDDDDDKDDGDEDGDDDRDRNKSDRDDDREDSENGDSDRGNADKGDANENDAKGSENPDADSAGDSQHVDNAGGAAADAAEDAAKAGDASQAAGAAADGAQAANAAGSAAGAAGNAAGAASAGASAGGAAAGAAAGGAGVMITPQDVKDIKDIGVKGVKDDLKDTGKSLAKGNVTDAVNNRTVQKAADVAMRSGEPTTMAVGAAVKVAGSFAEHGGEIDRKHPEKILSVQNAKALAATAKDIVPQNGGNPAAPPGTPGAGTSGTGLGEGGSDRDDDFEDVPDIGDEDPDDAHEDNEGAGDDDDKDEKDDKDDDEDKDDESDEDKSIADEEEDDSEEDEEKDDEKKEFAEDAAKKGVGAAANVAAAVAPKLLILKALYAFAQFLYMLLMQIIQIIAAGVCWLIALGQMIWGAIVGFVTALGQAILGAVGFVASTVQSLVMGTCAVVVAVVLIVIGVEAIRYDAELQNMLSSENGIIFSTGCSEVEKGTWSKLKSAFTNDPVSDWKKGCRKEAVAKQVAEFMKSSSLPVNEGGSQPISYIYGVLANAYAESGLEPTRVQGNPLGDDYSDMGDFFEDDMRTFNYKRSWKVDSIIPLKGHWNYTYPGRDALKKQSEYVRVTRRADTYVYGIGLFQFTTYRSDFLDFCYDNDDALVKFDGYVDPLTKTKLDDGDVYDWYTVGAQLSYMVKYPVKVMFFTQEYDPTALKQDGIENVEKLDYSDVSLGWGKTTLSAAEKEACYATVLFLGTFERPARYLNGGEDRANLIASRCEMAVSIMRKCEKNDALDSLNSSWASTVVDRLISGGGLATLDAISAGYTNCGMDTGTWNLTTPATVAVVYSHPVDTSEDSISRRDPTVAYKYIVSTLRDTVGDGWSDLGAHFGSCDRGVGYAYLVSGYDTALPLDLGSQWSYYQTSGRWTQVVDIPWSSYDASVYDTKEKRADIFQPGDVFIDYVDGKALHTYMYVGQDTIMEVVGIESQSEFSEDRYAVYGNKEMMQASYEEEYPHLSVWSIFRNDDSQSDKGGTRVFRCTSPEYDTTLRDLVRYGAPDDAA